MNRPGRKNILRDVIACDTLVDMKPAAEIFGVLPVNPVLAAWKIPAFVDSYLTEPEDVPPVIVIEHAGRRVAITGSHRLVALRQAFGASFTAEEAVDLGVMEIYHSTGFSPAAIRALDRRRGAGISQRDFDTIARCLPASVSEVVQ